MRSDFMCIRGIRAFLFNDELEEMMNSDNFVNLPPARLFFRCAVPAVITSVFGALYSVVDGIFIGRFLGGDALAAVNIIMPVIMIVEAVSNMIATGLSVNISMLLGRRRREDAPGSRRQCH